MEDQRFDALLGPQQHAGFQVGRGRIVEFPPAVELDCDLHAVQEIGIHEFGVEKEIITPGGHGDIGPYSGGVQECREQLDDVSSRSHPLLQSVGRLLARLQVQALLGRHRRTVVLDVLDLVEAVVEDAIDFLGGRGQTRGQFGGFLLDGAVDLDLVPDFMANGLSQFAPILVRLELALLGVEEQQPGADVVFRRHAGFALEGRNVLHRDGLPPPRCFPKSLAPHVEHLESHQEAQAPPGKFRRLDVVADLPGGDVPLDIEAGILGEIVVAILFPLVLDEVPRLHPRHGEGLVPDLDSAGPGHGPFEDGSTRDLHNAAVGLDGPCTQVADANLVRRRQQVDGGVLLHTAFGKDLDADVLLLDVLRLSPSNHLIRHPGPPEYRFGVGIGVDPGTMRSQVGRLDGSPPDGRGRETKDQRQQQGCQDSKSRFHRGSPVGMESGRSVVTVLTNTDNRQDLPRRPLQRAPRDRKDEGAVRVLEVVDDAVGVAGHGHCYPLRLFYTISAFLVSPKLVAAGEKKGAGKRTARRLCGSTVVPRTRRSTAPLTPVSLAGRGVDSGPALLSRVQSLVKTAG